MFHYKFLSSFDSLGVRRLADQMMIQIVIVFAETALFVAPLHLQIEEFIITQLTQLTY